MREEKRREQNGKSPFGKENYEMKEEKDQELMLVSQLEKQRLEICNESIHNKRVGIYYLLRFRWKSEVYEKFHDREGQDL